MQLNSEPFVAKSVDSEKDGSSDIESMLISGSQASHALRKGEPGFLAFVMVAGDACN